MRSLAAGLLAASLLLGASRTRPLDAQTPALPLAFPTPAEETDYL